MPRGLEKILHVTKYFHFGGPRSGHSVIQHLRLLLLPQPTFKFFKSLNFYFIMDFSHFNSAEQAHMTKVIEKRQV